MEHESQEITHEPPTSISVNGRVHLEEEMKEDDFFSSPEVAEAVFESVRQFAAGAETITLEELRSEVAQSSKVR